MERSSAFRRIGIFFAVAFWLFLLVSLASFHYDDPPAQHVYPAHTARNMCGPVGAFFAYYCYTLVGQGVFLLLFFAGVVMGMRLFKAKLSDMWLRMIGAALVSVAFAATLNNLSPGSPKGFPQGNGGILGIATSQFLEAHFNKVGSLIVLALSFMVGLVLAADELVVRAPALMGKAVGKARALTPEMPRPKFWFAWPKFFGRKMTAEASAKLAANEKKAMASINMTTTLARPETTRLASPNVFDGLARLLTEEEEDHRRAELQAASCDMPSSSTMDKTGFVLPQRDQGEIVGKKAFEDMPAISAQTTELAFRYDHDEPSAPAKAEAAHVDANDPPPAAAVELPAEKEQAVIQPEMRSTQGIVVRMPGAVQPRRTAPSPVAQELGEYSLPGWNLLGDAEHNYRASQETYVREKAKVLEQSLREFGIDASVVEINTGPVITMYEITMAPGTKVAQIQSLQNDIARSLAAANVRIVAPIPGKNTVGIEVPNAQKEKVRLKELMQLTSQEMQSKMAIPLFLGKDANGEPLVADLASMPHCLIAGTTGSGKSVCINTIIMSIMYTQRPDHVKLILFDPKIVEMAPFKDIPHLMCPVITETGKAASVLEWACEKMDERYDMLAEAGVRNLAGYNKLTREELFERFAATTPEEQAKVPKHMPAIVIIIDELADLMMTSGKEVEASIVRLAQKARAVGIHLILATQRPQATVVTGLIKANMPCKIAFRVASKMDSRIVLDQNGAELLLGQGDMLYLPGGAGKPVRSQGTYIEDKEIRDSVKLVAANAQSQYEPELVQIKGTVSMNGEMEQDEMFDDAVRVVLENQRGSVSLLQRKLNIGYGRASRLIEMMAASGILGDYKGSQAREVMMTVEDWDVMQNQRRTDEDSGMTV